MNPSPSLGDPANVDKAFRQVHFVASYPSLRAMPPDETRHIAFMGRSNSGKSSLINSLCYQKNLARSGKTPGLTRAINIFSWLEQDTPLRQDYPPTHFIDLPGYGYAQMSHTDAARTAFLLQNYLQQCPTLSAAVLIVDARRGLSAQDLTVLELLSEKVRLAIALSKADKCAQNALAAIQQNTHKILMQLPLSSLSRQVFVTSSQNNHRLGQQGLADLRRWLYGEAMP